MRTAEVNARLTKAAWPSWPDSQVVSPKPGHFSWVTPDDERGLAAALAQGRVPPDLESKLIDLAKGDLAQSYIEKHARTIIALLQAAHAGSFRDASAEELERLLWVLAYVRKDDDAISDYGPNGFVDDQRELRQVTADLDPILREFKAWRLRHQVPGLWHAPKT